MSISRYTRLTVLLLPLCGALACAARGTTAGHPGGEAAASARGAQPDAAARRAPDTASVDIGDGKSLDRLFKGRFAGVDVTTSGGGLRIRIRGGRSSFVNGDEPLVIVDGTPVPQGTGGIVFLNPSDITRIEVLKNPADIGVYGMRGANGVILITTLGARRR